MGSLPPISDAHRLPRRWRHSSVKHVCGRVLRFVEQMRVFVVLELQLGLVGLGLGFGLALRLKSGLGCPHRADRSTGMGRMPVPQPSPAMVRRWRFLRYFCVLYYQRAECSTFQTFILNSH